MDHFLNIACQSAPEAHEEKHAEYGLLYQVPFDNQEVADLSHVIVAFR